MKLDQYHSVYFLGIGGIGMSALARWFSHHGVKVYGYDRVRSELCVQLEKEGMDIHYQDDPSLLPERSVDNMLVIYTPAVPKDHQEKLQLLKEGFDPKKRSEVLGMISREFFTVAVAGTHGKTTTSCMITHIIREAGLDVTAFLGGISVDLNSNFIANNTDEAIAVVEADEFDRSFLTLHPNLAIVTNADADHLDIYGDRSQLVESFKGFIKKIEKGGTLFINEQFYDELIEEPQQKYKSYGINRGQFFAHNITVIDGFFHFDFQGEEKKIHALKMGVPGFHNIENATAAVAVALALNIPEDTIRKALASFRGVKRRFEYILRSGVVFIDDYAHHPTEISAFIKSLKALYPDRKLTIIFQPHLYSRTRDFADGFAQSLSLADTVILLDIYPAREMPIEGVTSEIIFDKITAEKVLVGKEELLEELTRHELDVVATVGAGDIDAMVEKIKNKLMSVYEAS